MKRFASLALGAIFVLAGVVANAAELKVGDQAPEFSMVGSDGKTYKLSDFKGKSAVVIAWYPRAFTGGCTKECKAFKEQGSSIRAYNVAYFTASNDPVEKNTEFAKSLSVDYPILSDPDSSVATAYGVLNPERKAAFRWTFYIGEDGKILAIDKMVKTESHGEDVAKRLGELGVKKK
ncbi:MAG: peroxiredoxin [Pirellulaceae bacterium]|nr:peroxiredoxin [Pirellulaceae bacterium]